MASETTSTSRENIVQFAGGARPAIRRGDLEVGCGRKNRAMYCWIKTGAIAAIAAAVLALLAWVVPNQMTSIIPAKTGVAQPQRNCSRRGPPPDSPRYARIMASGVISSARYLSG